MSSFPDSVARASFLEIRKKEAMNNENRVSQQPKKKNT